MEFPIRLNKYLAASGIASRREADALIASGGVLVNGKRAALGMLVNDGDTVTTKPQHKSKHYLAYYKGRGIITHSPGMGEVDIAMRLKKDFGLVGINPIGRLDKDSEGLLILSDDGRLTAPLLDTKNNIEKEYEVTIDKPITALFSKVMARGVAIEGYRTKPAKFIKKPGHEKKFNLILTEGKKHQIRRMCAALGYQVQSLKRIRVGPIRLGALKPNQYRAITGKELATLLATLHIAS